MDVRFMRALLKRSYEKTKWGFYLIHPFVMLYRFFQFEKYSRPEIFLSRKYKKIFGVTPDLENPKTFNEKMNWLKLNYFSRDMTICADKYAVRNFVRNRIGDEYLIPLYFHTTDPYQIIPENLPDEPCIVKVTHNSSGGFIIRDKNEISNWIEIQNSFLHKIHDNYFWHCREPQYKRIPPSIIVEKLLTTEEGSIPPDFKLHYFNGTIQFIQVDSDRMTAHKRALYTPEWKMLPLAWEYPQGLPMDKPENLSKMISLGERLAEDYPYVRVDFYDVRSRVYFGEITFHADGGFGKFDPPEYDEILGQKLSLNT